MTTAALTVDPAVAVGPVDRRLFGSFIEHLGRAVYDGFRGDVLDLVRELGVTTVRYPGGNFVSGTAGKTASVQKGLAPAGSTPPGTRSRPTRWSSTNSPGGRRRPAPS